MATLGLTFDAFMSYNCKMAADEASTKGLWAYISANETIQVITDADAADQQTRVIMTETVSAVDIAKAPDLKVRGLIGQGIIETDQVDTSNKPTVGAEVYVNDDGKLSSASANNVEVGRCIYADATAGKYRVYVRTF